MPGPFNYRHTIWNLMLKDFRIQYRNMSMGMLWSVINPLVMLGVLLVVFTLIRGNNRIEHFGIFLLLGIIPYNFFSQSLQQSTRSLVHNGKIIKKLNFPRLIIPVSAVLSQIIHLLIQLCLLFLFILFSGVPLTLHFLWLPVIFGVELLFLIGLGIFCSVLDVYYRDTQYIVQSLLTVLFWFTPIFYPASDAHDNLPRGLYFLFMANPLAGCIEAARRAVLYASPPEWHLFGMSVGAALAALLTGLLVFRKLEPNLSDHL